MITKKEFDSLFSDDILKKEYNRIVQLIDARFAEICEVFLRRTDWNRAWYDYGNCSYDSENSGGYFDPEDYKEEISIGGEYIEPPPGYDESFPTRWLWEDFEEELRKTTEKYKKQEVNKKAKAKEQRLARRQRLDALQATIRSKLTKEELKAIKFK